MPDEPPVDEVTRYVLRTYAGIARGRRYLQPAMGGKPMPLPISAREVDDWLAGHPLAMDRNELDAAVFALDALDRNVQPTTEGEEG